MSDANQTYDEPDNSTVDDWLGQRVARDEDRVDDAVKESGGSLDDAERRFEKSSNEADEYRAQHDQ